MSELPLWRVTLRVTRGSESAVMFNQHFKIAHRTKEGAARAAKRIAKRMWPTARLRRVLVVAVGRGGC
jgi:hypothetical protein